MPLSVWPHPSERRTKIIWWGWCLPSCQHCRLYLDDNIVGGDSENARTQILRVVRRLSRGVHNPDKRSSHRYPFHNSIWRKWQNSHTRVCWLFFVMQNIRVQHQRRLECFKCILLLTTHRFPVGRRLNSESPCRDAPVRQSNTLLREGLALPVIVTLPTLILFSLITLLIYPSF